MTKRQHAKALALACLFALAAATQVSAEDARGRELLNALGCKACHQLEGSGGALGPALDGVGQRLGAEQINKQITEPASANPSTMMPSYAHIPEEDLKALVDFLATLK
ncbi:c-type cytochrome [Geoalkalibacter sp.]|uniref:c-type cytochrome n=1 Tax=Geoalkalibacter sp. TaxID=3041440 RepID=UPI00272E251C|nr:cytochrome c [Geoalkalibacter sp.]